MIMTNQRVEELKIIAKNMRIDALDMALSTKDKGAHLGGSLSCIEILVVLYLEIMRYDAKNPRWEDRDIFIPSKNHCVLAHFPVLAQIGVIEHSEIMEFQKDGGRLTGYPKNLDIGLEYSGGSLGMAISVGIGMAISYKEHNKDNKVYILMGDGELNEGCVWEAFMAAAHMKLDNLVVIVDRNYLSYDGNTEEVMQLDSLEDKMKAFNWNVLSCDGHSVEALIENFSLISKTNQNKPNIIIARTIKGKGVSFMENKREWHHSRITKEQYDIAKAEILNEKI